MKEPKIRFNEFNGEWEEHTLGDFGSISMCKRIFKDQTSPNGDIPFFKIGTFGYTPDAYISRKLYEEYKQQYPFPNKGDILISAAGTIGRTVEYMGEDAYYQDSNIVWLNHSNKIDNKFLKYLYSKTNWNNLEGATIKRLYNSILLSTKSNCPSLAEQHSIASFFTTLDAQISASTSRLASLKQIKAASLQAMFPQEGETVPKLRFKGFEGEWEKVKLGEICTIKKGTQINKSELSSTGNYYVLNGGIDASGYINVYNTEKDTISISEGGNSCGFVNFNIERFWSGGHNYTLQNVSINNRYLFAFLKFREEDIMNKRVGSGLPNIQKNALENFNILFPVNKAEQLAIASFFTNLDRQITLQSQRLEKLKQIKAACLDKMFV